ncbi:MAG: transcription termination/antitermination protein NusG [Deltaproteobacteria bacterium]|jgi:transcriptional antiterminator NusG|nr:transcription termination/antitermination protein NusG [Deltaproteobacteria bacterium]TFG60076.1 MAG: transcription termination/antitermination protein NusG [Deltaproteobacteria bacterium]
MTRQWYVVHTYSGYEKKVKESLLNRIEAEAVQERFGEVLIPSETVVEMKKGKKRTGTRSFFPGYLLIQMELDEKTWHLVRHTPKVTGFVGGKTPAPIPESEVEDIRSQMVEGRLKPKPKVTFTEGENVRVNDGPFSNFNGVVESIKPDKGKVVVLVSIFGRATPVELDFTQVEKS